MQRIKYFIEWRGMGFIGENVWGKLCLFCHKPKNASLSWWGYCFVLYRDNSNQLAQYYVILRDGLINFSDSESFNTRKFSLTYSEKAPKLVLALSFTRIPQGQSIPICIEKGIFWSVPYPLASVSGRIHFLDFERLIKGSGFFSDTFIIPPSYISLEAFVDNFVWNWTFFHREGISFLMSTGFTGSLLLAKVGKEIFQFSRDEFSLVYQWRRGFSYPEIVTVTGSSREATLEIVNKRISWSSARRAHEPYFDFIEVKGKIYLKKNSASSRKIEFSGWGFQECKGAESKKMLFSDKKKLNLLNYRIP